MVTPHHQLQRASGLIRAAAWLILCRSLTRIAYAEALRIEGMARSVSRWKTSPASRSNRRVKWVLSKALSR